VSGTRRWTVLLGAGLAAPACAFGQGFLPPAADSSIPELDIPEIGAPGGGDVSIELPGGQRPPAGSELVRFPFNGLDLRGVTAFRGEDLAPLFADRLGADITLAELFEIADSIERTYREAGYILSFAYLPPQETTDGVFTLVVVEGYIASVTIEGVEDEVLLSRLEDRVAGLTAERPITAASLEAALDGLNSRLGGFRVSGVLQPAENGRGGSDLVVQAEIRDWEAFVAVDNRGSDYAGPLRATATGNLYNLGVLGDRLSVDAILTRPTREQRGFGVRYDRPVDWVLPLVLHAGLRVTDAHPGAGLEAFDVESRSVTLSLGAEAEVFRTLDTTATIGAGFERRDVDTDILGAPLARDRIGSLYIEGGVTHDGWLGGSSIVGLRLERGLPLFDTTDANDPASRNDAENDYTLIKLRAAHRQPIYENLRGLFALTGQYAFSPTYASREFALGGGGFGKAYDAGDAIGDHGIGASLELAYDVVEPLSWVRLLSPYVFIDGGVAWDSVNSKPQTIASAGLGLAADLPYDLRAVIEYAYAFGDEPGLDYEFAGADLGRSRVFFRLSKAFSQ